MPPVPSDCLPRGGPWLPPAHMAAPGAGVPWPHISLLIAFSPPHRACSGEPGLLLPPVPKPLLPDGPPPHGFCTGVTPGLAVGFIMPPSRLICTRDPESMACRCDFPKSLPVFIPYLGRSLAFFLTKSPVPEPLACPRHKRGGQSNLEQRQPPSPPFSLADGGWLWHAPATAEWPGDPRGQPTSPSCSELN